MHRTLVFAVSMVAISVMTVLLGGCPPRPPTPPPGRECAPAQPLCAGAACQCSDESTCTSTQRPRCASDTATETCCDGFCRFVVVADPVRCPCIVGEQRGCGRSGSQTCIDDNPSSPTADTDRSHWEVECLDNYFRDADGDGFCGETRAATSPPGAGWVEDCRLELSACEGNAAVQTPTSEECGNDIDDDCAGGDEACVPTRYHQDPDGDGFCGVHQMFDAPPPAPWRASCAEEDARCEGNGAVQTPTTEECDNEIDDDCAGGDAACPAVTYFQDPDGDHYCGLKQDFRANPGAPWTTTCNPEPASCENDATRNPGRSEICGNGKDDDCRLGDATCNCPTDRPVKCVCSGDHPFVSGCMPTATCMQHQPQCSGAGGSGCACLRR